MSALGELEPLDAVIHADTQWESAATVEMRDCEPLRTADLEAAAERERVKFGGAIQIPFLICESGHCWV